MAQAAYNAKLEKKGIPTVLIAVTDQVAAIKENGLANGIPTIRFVKAPPSGSAPHKFDKFLEEVLLSLTRERNKEEKKRYRYTPPPEPRIAFRGTYDDAREFYQMTYQLSVGPIARWTDGLPIVPPSEFRVREMLMGTSHSPEEQITLQYPRSVDGSGKKAKGWPVTFGPMKRTATVEKVAINAVMAGCKPEQLPVVLAMAESGCDIGTTEFWSQWQVVSGPITQELGMNDGVGSFDPGNIANAAIGRAFQLMAINLGGLLVGVNRITSFGSPLNTGGACIAENLSGLPTGWVGLNQESGFKKEDSVVLCASTNGGIRRGQFDSSSYRDLQTRGQGVMAEQLGVLGKAGPHNWLAYIIPDVWANEMGSITFLMTPSMARDLQKFGFKSKKAIYDWIWKKSFLPMGKMKKNALWYRMVTRDGKNNELTSGKPYGSLPENYLVPAAGDYPADNIILVVGGQEDISLQLLTFTKLRDNVFHIDPWR